MPVAGEIEDDDLGGRRAVQEGERSVDQDGVALAGAEQGKVAADVGGEIRCQWRDADGDAAAEHGVPARQVRQDVCVVAQAEAAFAFEDLWRGDSVSGLLPPCGAQLGQDGVVGVGNGGLAVGGQLAIVEVDDGLSGARVAGSVVLEPQCGVGLRQGVLQSDAHWHLAEEPFACGATQEVAAADRLGGQDEVDAAGAEQPGTLDQQVDRALGGVVVLAEEHLELVDDHHNAGHDGLGISQTVLADVLHAGGFEGGHALAVDGEEVPQDVDAVLSVGVQTKDAGVRQE